MLTEEWAGGKSVEQFKLVIDGESLSIVCGATPGRWSWVLSESEVEQ